MGSYVNRIRGIPEERSQEWGLYSAGWWWEGVKDEEERDARAGGERISGASTTYYGPRSNYGVDYIQQRLLFMSAGFNDNKCWIFATPTFGIRKSRTMTGLLGHLFVLACAITPKSLDLELLGPLVDHLHGIHARFSVSHRSGIT